MKKYSRQRIILEEDFKLKSSSGKILEIRILGKRNPKDILFNIEDIENIFDIDKSIYRINHGDSRYKEAIDYKYIGNSRSKKLYLTYAGIHNFILINREKNLEDYYKILYWLGNILFYNCDKNEIEENVEIFKMKGYRYPSIKTLDLIFTEDICGIYLFISSESYGNLKIDKKNLKGEYPKENFVGKFGYSANLKKRMENDSSNFNIEMNCQPILKIFSRMDEDFNLLAENKLKTFFSSSEKIKKFELKKYEELICFPMEEIDNIRKQFKNIQKIFNLKYKELESKLYETESKIEKNSPKFDDDESYKYIL